MSNRLKFASCIAAGSGIGRILTPAVVVLCISPVAAARLSAAGMWQQVTEEVAEQVTESSTKSSTEAAPSETEPQESSGVNAAQTGSATIGEQDITAAGTTPPPSDLQDTIANAKSLSLAFRAAAEKALPSVVTVLAKSGGGNEESSVLDIIGGEDEQIFDSVGSGVILESDGLVLTNHHVVADASRIEVRLSDGRQLRVEESMSDPRSDVAILRIPGESYPAAELGLDSELYVGDWVLAIGSPFTLEASVSAGIVSGTRRRQRLSRIVVGQFVQTDAAVNPGNSGGPLVDLEGRVVGINTAISSRTGGWQGIGFAIPIARAVWIKNELLTHGKVRRGFAGVRMDNVPFAVARQLDLPGPGGALVNAVTPGYPAEKSGLKPGDVVIEFGQQRIETAADFAAMVEQSPVGEPVPMTIIRGGERQVLTIQLEERK